MQTCEEKNFNRLIAEVHNHVGLLLREIPRLTDFGGRERLISDSDRSAFNQLKKLPGRHLEIDDKPVIICVLVGPSGSGKSTIFNLLTGLETPAGGAVRPMTFASTVAIPEPVYHRLDTAMFFPGFNVVELTSPTDLRNRHTPVTQIFKAPYKHPNSDFWLCLVDIPDFNTTETTNWDKAEQMIERADSVIYTVFTESYKDQKAYDFLKKCCRFSGSLTYLLTKIDAENPETSAQAVREDLLEFAGRDLEFKELRSNQISLHSYLQHAPFYYSPRSSKIELQDFRPLANTSASFKEFLFGQKGLEIIFSHYLQSISVGVKSGQNICEHAKLRNDELQEQINRLNKHLKIAATRIVGEEFPIFHILGMIRKLLEENRPNLLQRLIRPITMIGSGLKEVASSIHQKIHSLKPEELKSEVARRNDLERQRLQIQAEKLVEKWRDTFAEKNIGAENCRKTIETILTSELPPVDEEWELFVRSKLTEWIARNKNRWIWINVVSDLAQIVGASLLVADVFLDGGIGTLGLVAAIGGGSAAGGLLMTLFSNMGLYNEINEAHKLWKDLREKAYRDFLRRNLAMPLFAAPIFAELDEINLTRIEECRETCLKLNEISSKYEYKQS